MKKNPLRWQVLLATLAMLVVASGCVQLVADAGQATAISQAMSPTPSHTPSPSPEPPTPTLEAETTELVAQGILESETPGAIDLPVGENPTPTPDPQSVAQLEGEQDTWSLTATIVVLQITQTLEAGYTQTAQALGLGATATPTPTPTQQFGVTQAPPPISGADCVHEVRAGENLFRISLRYGVSINQIANASGVTNIQLIRVGQKLTIPGCGTTGVTPPPTTIPDGDFGTGGPITGGTVHVVQQYETLFEISMRYGVSINSIAAANGIQNINLIIIGDELVIPTA